LTELAELGELAELAILRGHLSAELGIRSELGLILQSLCFSCSCCFLSFPDRYLVCRLWFKQVQVPLERGGLVACFPNLRFTFHYDTCLGKRGKIFSISWLHPSLEISLRSFLVGFLSVVRIKNLGEIYFGSYPSFLYIDSVC